MLRKIKTRLYKNHILATNCINKICSLEESDCEKEVVILDLWFSEANCNPKLCYVEMQCLPHGKSFFIPASDMDFRHFTCKEPVESSEEVKASSVLSCFSLRRDILNQSVINTSLTKYMVCGNALLGIKAEGVELEKIGCKITRYFSIRFFRTITLWLLKNNKKPLFYSWNCIQPVLKNTINQNPWPCYRRLSGLNVSDIASIIEHSKKKYQVTIVSSLPETVSAKVVEEVDTAYLVDIFPLLSPELVVKTLSTITRKKAGRIIRELGREGKPYLALMKKSIADEIYHLAKQDPLTAGGMMEVQFLRFYHGIQVRDVINKIKVRNHTNGNIYYIYVTDLENHIQGILSIHNLLRADEAETLGNIMIKNIVTVRETDFRDAVAKKMEKYHLLALPVVDKNNCIKGIVTIHDVLQSVMIFPR